MVTFSSDMRNFRAFATMSTNDLLITTSAMQLLSHSLPNSYELFAFDAYDLAVIGEYSRCGRAYGKKTFLTISNCWYFSRMRYYCYKDDCCKSVMLQKSMIAAKIFSPCILSFIRESIIKIQFIILTHKGKKYILIVSFFGTMKCFVEM